MRPALLLFVVAGCGQAVDGPVVRINEILAQNDSGERDESNDREDWLELVNVGGEEADLSGWGLTDALGEADPWTIEAGTTLAPGEYLVVWCDNQADDGPYHASFQLAAVAGGSLALLDADGALAEEVQFGTLWANVSWARVPDGGDTWRHLLTPTPGATNEPEANRRR